MSYSSRKLNVKSVIKICLRYLLNVIMVFMCPSNAFPKLLVFFFLYHSPLNSNQCFQGMLSPLFCERYLQVCTWTLTLRFVLQLDIVQQEYIHQAGLNQSDLVRVAFSAQGKWLATVEEREETDLELQLKLWFFDEETQR